MSKNRPTAGEKADAENVSPPKNQPDNAECDTATIEQLAADVAKREEEVAQREAAVQRREEDAARREAASNRPATKIDRKQARPLLEHLAKSGTGEEKLRLVSNHIERGGDMESLLEKLPSGTAEKITEFLQN